MPGLRARGFSRAYKTPRGPDANSSTEEGCDAGDLAPGLARRKIFKLVL